MPNGFRKRPDGRATVPRRVPPAAPRGKPWDRIDGENLELFERFVFYRDDVERPRSYPRVAAAFKRRLRAIERQASKYRWQERIAAWDQHVDQARQKASAARRIEAHERHGRLGRLLQGKAIEAIAGGPGIKAVRPKNAMEAARLADVGVKLELLSIDAPTEIVGGEVKLTGLSEEARAAARIEAAKAAGKQ